MKPVNYFLLLAALFVFLLLSPSIAEHLPDRGTQMLLPVSFALVTAARIWMLSEQRGTFWLVAVLTVLIVLFAVASVTTGWTGFTQAGLVTMLIFLCLTTWQTGRDVLVFGEVTTNRLAGAVCVYLMGGLIWAVLYTLLYSIHGGAFTGSLDAAEPFWDFAYFSYVTITTLGYGDISPLSPLSRALAYTEAVAGQFYVAIVVASMVGAYLTQHTDTLIKRVEQEALSRNG